MVVSFFSVPKHFKNFDAVISLGWNCYPAKYLKNNVKSSGSIFDYIGSQMSYIIDVITNNWETMFNKDKYISFEFYKAEFNLEKHGKPTNPFIVHSDYKFSFPHDAKTISEVTPEFMSTLQSRIRRFENYCRSSKKILFIRLERNPPGLIEEHDSKKRDMELLPSFIELIRSKYGRTQINMIYINTEKDGWNEDKTIFFVKIDSLIFDWEVASDTIHKLFVEKNVYSEFNSM
jgi:hypothetical protein